MLISISFTSFSELLSYSCFWNIFFCLFILLGFQCFFELGRTANSPNLEGMVSFIVSPSETVPGDFGWLAGAVAGAGSGCWGMRCWGGADWMVRAELGTAKSWGSPVRGCQLCGPGAVYMEGILAGQLKWPQARLSQDTLCGRSPGRASGAAVLHRPQYMAVLHEGGALLG